MSLIHHLSLHFMSEKKEILHFQLTSEFIELNRLLKFVGVVNSGAEAGLIIKDELVSVNDQIEIRKRKKLRSGDIVGVQNILIKIS